MTSKVNLILVAAALIVTPVAANAQFGNLFGGAKSGGANPDEIVKKYTTAAQSVVRGQQAMLKAIDADKDLAKTEAEAANLESGTNDPTETSKIVTESAKTLQESMKNNAPLKDAEAKARFAQGLGYLVKGVLGYKGVVVDLKGFKPSITSVGGTAVMASKLVTSLPNDVPTLVSLLSAALEYAKGQDVDIPPDATGAL